MVTFGSFIVGIYTLLTPIPSTTSPLLTALFVAAGLNQTKFCKILIQNGAHPDVGGPLGYASKY